MYKLSICIPTFNRAKLLKRCLDSIIVSLKDHNWVEICVSDNSSPDNTVKIIESYQSKLPIIFSSNNRNLGVAQNVLEVTKLAKGDFIWLVGDDDYLLPDALDRLYIIMNDPANQDIKFFYNNALKAANLDEEVTKGSNFDSTGLKEILHRRENKKIEFLELIDYKISWDFLGGMFMSIFEAKSWRASLDMIDHEQLLKPGTFSSLENTFIHLKIFPYAFSGCQAFINYNPLIIATSDARDWSAYWYLVHLRWLIAALEEYRKNGLGLIQYIRNKNKILEKFFPYFIMMLWHKKKYSLSWKDLITILAKNCLYPNFYFSIFYSIYYLFARMLRN